MLFPDQNMSSPDKKQASPKEQNTGDPVGSHPVIPDGTGTALPRQQMPEVASEEYLRTMPPQSQYQMQPWVRCGFLQALHARSFRVGGQVIAHVTNKTDTEKEFPACYSVV